MIFISFLIDYYFTGDCQGLLAPDTPRSLLERSSARTLFLLHSRSLLAQGMFYIDLSIGVVAVLMSGTSGFVSCTVQAAQTPGVSQGSFDLFEDSGL